jgi:hypothetical protein
MVLSLSYITQKRRRRHKRSPAEGGGGGGKSVRRAIESLATQHAALQTLIDAVQGGGVTTPGLVEHTRGGHTHVKAFTEIPHQYLTRPKKWCRVSANKKINVVVPLHWYYKDVSPANLKVKKEAIEALVAFVYSRKLKLTLLGDFNTSDIIEDTAFLKKCGFYVPLAVDTRDAQGNITYILTTDPDFIESTATLNHTYSVPEVWQSDYKKYLRTSVSQFKAQYENDTLRPRLHAETVRKHLFAQLTRIVLATDTAFLLDHTPPRSITSADGACTITSVCPCGATGAPGKEFAAIYPLFGFMVAFIVKELPMLEIDKKKWVHALSTCFYKEVLHLKDDALKKIPKSQYCNFPLSFKPIKAFFKMRVLKPFNALDVEQIAARR